MQPPQDPTNYPRPDGTIGKYVPFQGDKIYVIIELLLFLIGIGVTFALMPGLTDEALKNAAAQTGPKVDPDMMRNIMMGTMGCAFVVCLPISIVVWINMWKGKKWAFIVSIILLILGLLSQIRNFGSPTMMTFGIVTTVTLLARFIYVLMRMIGKVGPALS
jgi:hypothetical protein